MTTEPKAEGGEAVALLARIRDLLFRADPGCLGDGITAAGQPYPIRDEVMDAITRTLATTPRPSAEPQGVVGHVLRDVSQARMHVNVPEGTPLYTHPTTSAVEALARAVEGVMPHSYERGVATTYVGRGWAQLSAALAHPEIAALLKGEK